MCLRGSGKNNRSEPEGRSQRRPCFTRGLRCRCLGEQGKVVFELGTEPPSTLAKQLKTVIQRDAGVTLKVEARMAADPPAEDSSNSADAVAAPETASAPPAPAAAHATNGS